MRVLLTNLPRLLQDILSEALAGESDMEIVGGTAGGDLAPLIGQFAPDVVIVQAARDAAKSVHDALGGVTVVAIEPRGEHAIVFRAEETILLSDVSPTTIIIAVRSALRASG